MRHGWWIPFCLAACGGDGSSLDAPAPPDTCGAGRLVYNDNIHVGNRALGAGDHTFSTFAFVPGAHPTFDISDGGTEHIHLEGEEPLVPGDSVASRGFVQLDHPLDNETVPYDFGNCESGSFSGTLTLAADGATYQFTIENLHKPPYCSGSSITGGFSGCYKKP